ncbi:MAG: hypothetical protein IRZ32_17235 [Solirubrobacteraceae bacterium]|nr:hypothetical protein [Solirubrobacteraceae bacterium]
MRRARALIGPASVAAYVAALAAIQATGTPGWQQLASSPAAIADGRLWLLLTSGLVIDGLPWLQLALLAVVLAVALDRLGAARLWAVALVAHVGAAVLAYAAIGLLWLVDRTLVEGAVDEPDYGVSVVLAGELGALALAGGRRMALFVGLLVLGGIGVGVADASLLANVEHLLGFVLGALTVAALGRRVP